MNFKNVLIFGDSYSTFEGYIPNGFAVYYSKTGSGETDVRNVEETWWYPLIKETDSRLIQNNSWSGSTICYSGYQGDCSETSSFICRLNKLTDAEEMTMDTKIAEDLGADSLDVVELLMSIEDEFEVEIPDEEIENMKTIGDVVEYIQSKM